jgi:hypothetical protein
MFLMFGCGSLFSAISRVLSENWLFPMLNAIGPLSSPEPRLTWAKFIHGPAVAYSSWDPSAHEQVEGDIQLSGNTNSSSWIRHCGKLNFNLQN